MLELNFENIFTHNMHFIWNKLNLRCSGRNHCKINTNKFVNNCKNEFNQYINITYNCLASRAPCKRFLLSFYFDYILSINNIILSRSSVHQRAVWCQLILLQQKIINYSNFIKIKNYLNQLKKKICCFFIQQKKKKKTNFCVIIRVIMQGSYWI